MRNPQVDPQAFKDAYVASIHDSIDAGKRGLINDGDPTHYIYQGDEVIQAPMEEAGDPIIRGYPGQKMVVPLQPEAQQQNEMIMKDYLFNNVYGTGGMV